MSELNWTCKPFDQLSVVELYDILRLRSEVFVVEQNCVYQDMDHKDQASLHLTGWLNDLPVAYARIIPPGISYPGQASIGRVCTAPAYRNTGEGKALMKKAIELTIELYKPARIKIGAQLYLEKFYSSLGFSRSSEEYLEDGIPHIEMIYSL